MDFPQQDNQSAPSQENVNSQSQDTGSSSKKHHKSIWKEIFQFAFIVIFIILPFRLFVAQPFVVNGQSMEPTFDNGEYLIVDQISYRLEHPDRGAVIIFKYPNDPSKFFIKRVIGLPNEKVVIHGGDVTIYNDEHPDGMILNEPYITFRKDETFSAELGPDQYFVMGDNRANSSDSRVWGALDESYIVGRPVLRLLPLGHLSFLPGVTDY